MATWKDVGTEIFQVALELYETDHPHYRSCCSRFYYAVFSILTYDLIQRNAAVAFRDGRETPGHAQLPNLIDTYFVHMTDERRSNIIKEVRDLYRYRISADYTVLRVDKIMAQNAHRSAEKIFKYLGVNHGRKGNR